MKRLLAATATLACLSACSTASLHEDYLQTREQDRAAAQALAASAPADSQALADWLSLQHNRIQANRAQARAQFAQAEAQCWQRFAVNACLKQARGQRRAALDRLQQEELALNELERQRRYPQPAASAAGGSPR